MKFDATLSVDTQSLHKIPQIVRAAEALGFDGLWTPETQHNAFLPLALAAEHTERLLLGTAVAIAFARSPMVIAQAAWDMQALARGRFVLGLGTQVKAHIERRYGMEWGQPVARLREYIVALRSIWASWQTGARLNFEGQFYRHTLMTPFFNPGPIADPAIPIYIAGVNEALARLAGEACDGFHAHPFHTAKYLNEVVRPQVAAGAEAAGRTLADVTLVSAVFVVSGPNEAAIQAMKALAREQLAFYASTPSYRVVLAAHGWDDIGEQLSRLAAAKRWADMGALVSDDMIDAFAVVAPFDQLGAALRARYEGVLDRISPYIPFAPGELDDAWRAVIASVHEPGTTTNTSQT